MDRQKLYQKTLVLYLYLSLHFNPFHEVKVYPVQNAIVWLLKWETEINWKLEDDHKQI